MLLTSHYTEVSFEFLTHTHRFMCMCIYADLSVRITTYLRKVSSESKCDKEKKGPRGKGMNE